MDNTALQIKALAEAAGACGEKCCTAIVAGQKVTVYAGSANGAKLPPPPVVHFDKLLGKKVTFHPPMSPILFPAGSKQIIYSQDQKLRTQAPVGPSMEMLVFRQPAMPDIIFSKN